MDQATATQTAAQVGANAAPQVGTAEYDAAMAAKADGIQIQAVSPDGRTVTQMGGNTEQQTNQRPAWLPEKFQSPEDMAKAYAELEKRFSTGQQTQTQTQTQQQAEPQQTQQTAQLDISKYDAEFQANGGLSEASYQELERFGFNRETVDAYIEGQQARGERFANAGFEVAGGKERYMQMVEWAKANLPRQEIAAFNAQVTSGNLEAMKLAVAGLNAKFTQANGVNPGGLMMGSANPVPATGAFQSRAQVVEAMSDPRYSTDPAYRQQVMNKLANSNVF